MEQSIYHQLPVEVVYNNSPAFPIQVISMEGVHVPVKKTFTISGIPILAFYKGETVSPHVYLLVTREIKGYLFNHYYYPGNLVQVTDEDFYVSEKDQKDVEDFLSVRYH